MKNDMNIVLVEWYDAKFCPDLQTFEEAISHEPDMFKCVGFLLYQDERKVIIASEKGENNSYRNVEVLPAGMIVAITALQEKSTERHE